MTTAQQYCCPKFEEWMNSNDEYIGWDDERKKWCGDFYQGQDSFIFEYCPFCGVKL